MQLYLFPTPASQLCLGVRRVKQGLPKADELQRLPGDISSYHFGCLGYSAHFKQQPLDGSSGIIIPYCEGIEVGPIV